MRHTEQMSTFSSPLLENTPHSSMNILPILLFKSYELTFNVHLYPSTSDYSLKYLKNRSLLINKQIASRKSKLS